ncbi:hypothetical protein ACHAQA_000169 [Verticillium albo-atrum]
MASTPTRRPLTGSCHCKATRYIVYLTLPLEIHPVTPVQRSSPPGLQCIYRCNCTVCHKAGILHVRPLSPPDDFVLLAPLDPTELGSYQPKGEGGTHFFFCKACGGRCFSFQGLGEVATVDRKGLGLEGEGEVEVWRPKKETWTRDGHGSKSYLSVNGMTIDYGQEGADLRVWKESGALLYLDCLEASGNGRERPRYERPHEGGCY